MDSCLAQDWSVGGASDEILWVQEGGENAYSGQCRRFLRSWELDRRIRDHLK